jgi:hypothetical protein
MPYPEGMPTQGPAAPGGPHVLWLNFDGGMVVRGNCSNALSSPPCSFIPSVSSCNYPVYTNSFRKPMIIALVQQYYAPFNVQVVTTKPTSGTYAMVFVGPGSTCVGAPQGAAGVGPLDCGNTNEPDVTFAFTDAFDGDTNTARAVHNIAVTIGQESAHAYGLGHTNNRNDIQYPAVSGVEMAFLNQDMAIYDLPGSSSSDCTGTGRQNSYQFLINNVGANPNQGPDTVPPQITFVSPHDGDTVPSGFHIEFNAFDNVGVASVDVFLDGNHFGGTGTAPYAFDVPGGFISAGQHKLKGVAKDAAGNTADSGEITVTVRAQGQTPGDVGASCTTDSDCPGGFCALNGSTRFCTKTCDPADSLSCPGGYSCVATSGTNVCGPNAPKQSGGCEVARTGEGTGLGLAGLLLLATCVLQRKRFRSR